MRKNRKIKQGILTGLLSLFFGCLLTIIPIAIFTFTSIPSGYGLRFLIIIGSPIYYSFFHFIPYLVAGGVTFCFQRKKRFFSFIISLFISIIASITAERLYFSTMGKSFNKYATTDYCLIIILELCYIISFLFITNEFLQKGKE